MSFLSALMAMYQDMYNKTGWRVPSGDVDSPCRNKTHHLTSKYMNKHLKYLYERKQIKSSFSSSPNVENFVLMTLEPQCKHKSFWSSLYVVRHLFNNIPWVFLNVVVHLQSLQVLQKQFLNAEILKDLCYKCVIWFFYICILILLI